MAGEIHFPCPECGKSWKARADCRHCGEAIVVPAPVARQAGPEPHRDRTLLIAAGLCFLGVIVVGGMVWELESKRQARAAEYANQFFAEKVAAARPFVAQRDWEPAIALLEDALATDKATERTELGDAEWLLAAARQSRADDIADAELRRAEERAKAERRRAEERAEAERRRLEEVRRQAEAERRQREARVRATPPFQELLAFIEQTRARRDERENEALLAYLFRELGVKDAREQERLRKELRRRPDDKQILERNVAKMRAKVNALFGSLKGLEKGDDEVFGRIVDQELDKLLEALER